MIILSLEHYHKERMRIWEPHHFKNASDRIGAVVEVGPGNAGDAVEPEAADRREVAQQHQRKVVEQRRRILEGPDEELGKYLKLPQCDTLTVVRRHPHGGQDGPSTMPRAFNKSSRPGLTGPLSVVERGRGFSDEGIHRLVNPHGTTNIALFDL